MVIKQVASGHRSFSLSHYLPSRQRCFITVTRARAKGQLREQSIHLVSLLFGSCGAGEGQSEAVGISKPVCLLDLCVTLCSLSVKSSSLSYFFILRPFLWPHYPISLNSPLSSLSLFLTLGMCTNFPLTIFFFCFSFFLFLLCLCFWTYPWYRSLSFHLLGHSQLKCRLQMSCHKFLSMIF